MNTPVYPFDARRRLTRLGANLLKVAYLRMQHRSLRPSASKTFLLVWGDGLIGVHAASGGQRFLPESDMVPNFIFPLAIRC
jgi:hypothetical protein